MALPARGLTMPSPQRAAGDGGDALCQAKTGAAPQHRRSIAAPTTLSDQVLERDHSLLLAPEKPGGDAGAHATDRAVGTGADAAQDHCAGPGSLGRQRRDDPAGQCSGSSGRTARCAAGHPARLTLPGSPCAALATSRRKGPRPSALPPCWTSWTASARPAHPSAAAGPHRPAHPRPRRPARSRAQG